MRGAADLALSGLLTCMSLLLGVLLLATTEGAEDEARGGGCLPVCPNGRHTWRVWTLGFSPDDYYYRCSRCGWFAPRAEVERD